MREGGREKEKAGREGRTGKKRYMRRERGKERRNEIKR